MDLPLVVLPGMLDHEMLGLVPSELTRFDSAANLKIPVSPWFCCTPFLFQQFISFENGLSRLFEATSSRTIQKIILEQRFSPATKSLLRQSYRKYIGSHHFTLKLLRSHPNQVLPPQPAGILKGDAVLMDKIRTLWASAASTNLNGKLPQVPYILVMRLEIPEWTGYCYSIHPHQNDKKLAYVEIFHKIPSLSPANQHPSSFRFKKLSKEVIPENVTATVPQPFIVMDMFQKTCALEQKFQHPIMVSFMVKHKHLTLTSITPLYQELPAPDFRAPFSSLKALPVLAEGRGAGIGIVTAQARVILSEADLGQVKTNEILIIDRANLKLSFLLPKIKGLVTVVGGVTSHTALLAREYGIPSIMGVKGILNLVKTGDLITIDGGAGIIYRGSLPAESFHPKDKARDPEVLATKILLDISSPILITSVNTTFYQGIGLIRGEVYLSENGIHPHELIHNRSESLKYSQFIKHQLNQLALASPTSPLAYKLTDLPQNDRNQLARVPVFDFGEVNPFLGLRGLAWSLHLPEYLSLELKAIKLHLADHHLLPFSIILPFVRSIEEIRLFKRLAASKNLERSSKLKIYLSLDNPALISQLPVFAQTGIDGFYVNCNHLTALALGIDPENSAVNEMYDQKNPALISLYYHACEFAREHNLPIYFYGYSVNSSSYLLHELVHFGVTGVVVPPQSVSFVHSTLAQAELERVR